jgi:hypothetical protein
MRLCPRESREPTFKIACILNHIVHVKMLLLRVALMTSASGTWHVTSGYRFDNLQGFVLAWVPHGLNFRRWDPKQDSLHDVFEFTYGRLPCHFESPKLGMRCKLENYAIMCILLIITDMRLQPMNSGSRSRGQVSRNVVCIAQHQYDTWDNDSRTRSWYIITGGARIG